MQLVPHELYVEEVFFPPMQLDAALGADPRMLDRMIDVAMSVWPSTSHSD
jgi:hypothetical protein